MILSSDGDLAQILDYSDTISLYSPVKKTFVDKKNRIVDFKAIVGDRSDNIPGVYRLGEKTFEKMLDDKALWNEKLKGDNKKVYEKFLQIVDLSVYPPECHEEAIRQCEELPFNEFNTGQIELFFYENDMMDQLTRWGNTQRNILETLLETGVQVIDFVNSSEPIVNTVNDTTEDELGDMLAEFC
jgi:5'-3' exonuclease